MCNSSSKNVDNTQSTSLSGVSTKCTTGTSINKSTKLHTCTPKCTHDAQKIFSSSESDDENIENRINNDRNKSTKHIVNDKSTVPYHFGNIVAEEIKDFPPAKKLRVMSEILQVIEKFQSN